MSKTRTPPIVVGLLLALAACGDPGSPAEALAKAPPIVAAALPAEVRDAPAAPATPSGQAVDTCALLDAAAAAGSVGALAKPPEAQVPQGSLLGGCNYLGDRGMLMLTARPAGEFAGTVAYAGKRGGLKAVEGLAGSASLTSMGLLLQPAGKAYFLVLYPLLGGRFDEAAAVQLAHQVKN